MEPNGEQTLEERVVFLEEEVARLNESIAIVLEDNEILQKTIIAWGRENENLRALLEQGE